MKYQKGEFITVPNKHALLGMKGSTQSVYLWLCAHANEAGVCYPSKDTIAEEAGISPRSVSDRVKELVQKGILKKTARKKGDGSKRQLSNLYQLVIVGKKDATQVVHGEGAGGVQMTVHTVHGEGAPVAEELNPLNENHIELNKSPDLSGETAMVEKPSTMIPENENPEKIPGDPVNTIMMLFKPLNEAYAKFFNQPPQRKAVKSLLERHSHQEIVVMLEYVSAHAGEEYAITVSSPLQLEDKWSRLEIKRKQKPKISAGNDLIARSNEELNNPKYGKVF